MPAVEGLGQQRVDPLANGAAVALARQEHERGDEAVELVEAKEDAHFRPFAEIEDAERGRQQLVLRNLEQLVAGEGVQHMRQRLAVVTGQRQPRSLEHLGNLAAQERDLGRQLRRRRSK